MPVIVITKKVKSNIHLITLFAFSFLLPSISIKSAVILSIPPFNSELSTIKLTALSVVLLFLIIFSISLSFNKSDTPSLQIKNLSPLFILNSILYGDIFPFCVYIPKYWVNIFFEGLLFISSLLIIPDL